MKRLEVFTGRVGQIRDLKELANNNCLISFSVAETPRVKVGEKWEDGVTIWTDVTVFGDMARNFQRSAIKPGTFVTVVGTRTAHQWTPKDSTEKRTSQNIVAEQVAVSLTRWHYVTGIENVGGGKGGQNNSASQTNQSAAASTAGTASTAETNSFDNEDPFAGSSDDPFGLD